MALDPMVDLRPLFDKYQQHRLKIVAEVNPIPSFNFAPKEAPANFNSTVKSEVPKFTFSPVHTEKAESLAAAPIKEELAKPEVVKIEQPSFSFNTQETKSIDPLASTSKDGKSETPNEAVKDVNPTPTLAVEAVKDVDPNTVDSQDNSFMFDCTPPDSQLKSLPFKPKEEPVSLSLPQFKFGQQKSDSPFTFPTLPKLPTFGSNSLGFGSENKTAFAFPFSTTSTAAPAVSEGGEEDESIPEGEQESFSGDRTNTALIKTGAGEEGEQSLQEARIKLFIFDRQQGWKDLGIGIFKINRQENGGESSKSRMLCRAEGSGKVLLNSAITKDLTCEYEAGKKDLSVVCLNHTDAKLAKYLIRVKEPSVAQSLYDCIRTIV